jgi:Na+:H+ antiporter, NhaA family
MHQLLFHRQHALEDDHLEQYARQVGLDIARFESPAPAAMCSNASAATWRAEPPPARWRGTPTLFLNGRVHRGSYDVATLLRALEC